MSYLLSKSTIYHLVDALDELQTIVILIKRKKCRELVSICSQIYNLASAYREKRSSLKQISPARRHHHTISTANF